MAKKITVKPDESGMRLDRWVKTQCSSASFIMIAKCIRKGQIKVEGKKSEIAYKLETDQCVILPDFLFNLQHEPAQNKPRLTGKNLVLAKKLLSEALYIDEHVIIINKPSGLAVQGGSGISVSIDDLAENWRDGDLDKPRIVHRLDKETSGVLILARTRKVAQTLSLSFQNREITKKYLVLLSGVPKPLTGVIQVPIAKKHSSAEAQHVNRDDQENLRESITKYRVVDFASKTVSLVEMTPITGRTHQIRAHSAAIGCPILGDDKYYSAKKDKLLGVKKQLYLHAYSIEFCLFDQNIKVKAPLPESFQSALEHFGLDHKSGRVLI